MNFETLKDQYNFHFIQSYKSEWKGRSLKVSVESSPHSPLQYVSDQSDSTPLVSSVIMWLITALSYLLLLLTLPISYWWCVVTLAEHDRMVIFRLGKMQGARGPGKVGSININIIIVDVGVQVVTFPWLDQCKKVDVRASAFSVPPQQFITQVQSSK